MMYILPQLASNSPGILIIKAEEAVNIATIFFKSVGTNVPNTH